MHFISFHGQNLVYKQDTRTIMAVINLYVLLKTDLWGKIQIEIHPLSIYGAVLIFVLL